MPVSVERSPHRLKQSTSALGTKRSSKIPEVGYCLARMAAATREHSGLLILDQCIARQPILSLPSWKRHSFRSTCPDTMCTGRNHSPTHSNRVWLSTGLPLQPYPTPDT